MKHFKLTTESKVNAFGITLFRVELIINCNNELIITMN